jgi:shikimate dehydrogenase
MIHLGLVGWPVSHSLSPRLQNTALKTVGLAGEYLLYPVAPGDELALRDLLNRVRNGKLTGLNVTIPYKQAVIPLLDRLTFSANSIGAVNTIYLENGSLVGHNTDAPGFLADLKNFDGNLLRKNSGSALVLGAGGSARSVVNALAGSFQRILIAARNVDQAQKLVTSFHDPGKELIIEAIQMTPDKLKMCMNGLSLIVNTTPVGMYPITDHSPWPESLNFPGTAVVYDLIYNPRETLMVRMAREQSLRATTGLGMLVEQAALGFEIWTGLKPPRAEMFSSLEE